MRARLIGLVTATLMVAGCMPDEATIRATVVETDTLPHAVYVVSVEQRQP